MTHTILYVDDEIKETGIQRVLEREGNYLVCPFSDGRKAMAAIDDGLVYDLGLIDLSLQWGSDGLDVARHSRQVNPKVPIIILSAYDQPKCETEFPICLLKPVRTERLLETIGQRLPR